MFSRIQTYLLAILSVAALQFQVIATPLDHTHANLNPEIWESTAAAPHHDSIVRISLDSGSGTGVVVYVDSGKPQQDGYWGYCITAYHVVQDDRGKGNIGVQYRNGKKAKGAKVVAFDPQYDVALVWVWVPKDIKPVKVASLAAAQGDRLEFVGLGGGVALECCLRHFAGRASVTTTHSTIYADVALLPGDSGGGLFNEHQELLGVISGGWFWFEPSPTSMTSAAPAPTMTWPARACNVEPMWKLFEEQLGESARAIVAAQHTLTSNPAANESDPAAMILPSQ